MDGGSIAGAAFRDRHALGYSESIKKGKIHGLMVHDARVAALCIEHGVRELWSADRDFNRFSGLVVRNPLID